AAILFADIVGFTAWAERHRPAEALALLREVQGLIERAVFEHGGAVDKFIGDGVMASFGTMEEGPAPAEAPLACFADILVAFEAWSATQPEADRVALSLGLHAGPVVVGDVGSARRMERAVLGDTVNVAARIEEMTRALGVRALVSADVVERAATLPEGLRSLGPQQIPKRAGAVALWAL
ncbi:MAG: adenylate/guanylate cyclase domain-containing protein, partial [Pseudomonadota bacterium]